MKYLIGMGSNMGDSVKILVRAAKELQKYSCFCLLKHSSLYKTAPWGMTDQPSFINAVLLIDWSESGEKLLSLLQMTEKRFGRTREVRWGPRTLDLDILWREGPDMHTNTLDIPHPFFWDRAFVLVPLGEIWPGFTHGGQSVENRIDSLSDVDTVRKAGVYEI